MMKQTIDIKVKDDWEINPNDELVNAIFRALEAKDGQCMNRYLHRTGNTKCPCDDYLLNDECICKLYIKK